MWAEDVTAYDPEVFYHSEVRWAPVYGYEGRYEISTEGVVVSVHGDGSRRPTSASETARGYYYHRLTTDGVMKKKLVHRMVLEAFVGPRDDMWALHADDNPKNNRLSNLRWGTPQDNRDDWIKNGRKRAEPHHESVKTECPKGHPYSPENTRIKMSRGRPSRGCRACERDYERRRYAAKKNR